MMWHIIGKNSYIAQRLLHRIEGKKEILCYARHGGPDSIPLDLANPKPEDVQYMKPGDYVVLFAAVSSPDECERQYESSYAINVSGTQALIERCIARGANVLFFSSDVVVGATEKAADEHSAVHPVGKYGAMKRMIEEMFCGEQKFKTFRLSYVFSRQDKFFKYLQSCRESGQLADVFDALYRNVIYVEDVIDGIIALSESFMSWDTSVFHASGKELLSRKDLAELYRREVDPDFRFTVSVPEQAFFTARPNVIETKSLYFSDLIGKCPTSIGNAIHQEFDLD